MGEVEFDRKHGLVSFDGGERWYLQECLDMLRGLHLLSGMITVPKVAGLSVREWRPAYWGYDVVDVKRDDV